MSRISVVSTISTIVVLLLVYPAVASADAVSDWNAIMLATIASQNPFAQARSAAITELAVFNAVNACTGQYKPYLGNIIAPSGASPDAAAMVSAHDVLKSYFPASAATLDAALVASLAAIPNGSAKDDGIAVGQAAAAAMIALRASDGSAPPATFLPSNVTPFGIRSSQQFRSRLPPALTSSKYTQSYLEVKAVGDVNSTQRPQDRADVARFFNVASAAYVWNSVVQQLSGVQGSSLSERARAFALVNMAISDGLVSSMESKYYYVRWRPVTAIRGGSTDGNPDTEADPAFTPFIPTPPFPSYPSAHASGSYAARVIAERIFGCGSVAITLSHPGIPDVVLHYTDLKTVTDDIDDARVYGGIHFRYDQEAGARQGRSVGSFVFSHNLNTIESGDVEDAESESCQVLQ
jgi:hypothetical protein